MADLQSAAEELVAAIDTLVGADPSQLADGEAVVFLHRQLARLEAATTRAAAAFDAGGTWGSTAPARLPPGSPPAATFPLLAHAGVSGWDARCAPCQR